ncbi:hypothetical protein BCR33DRAFT_849767 [Rhizoclosmatium globosum]|uniref:DUF3987 domain-containing protein n=1 Tax=Rhizoclosmatium globosum TaxID=329046 RepID=A0A1Y2BYN2_9FUNG|nr:hypothetical protein HDU99_000952 [Rhizoclosmatium hyalinum]ORY39879.1 hypothetical protein BCR33DRAFT_719709 [Rhizoclosmatium globosum]ORY45479.1 hypothetical protein BCR33DRAFT_849767 [Rhizoclosmatium globosum]|eukprot:ORY39879.1 hypothetical protein BCR33DRAFT_719709 [Rhizoclosmatium globosum]
MLSYETEAARRKDLIDAAIAVCDSFNIHNVLVKHISSFISEIAQSHTLPKECHLFLILSITGFFLDRVLVANEWNEVTVIWPVIAAGVSSGKSAVHRYIMAELQTLINEGLLDEDYIMQIFTPEGFISTLAANDGNGLGVLDEFATLFNNYRPKDHKDVNTANMTAWLSIYDGGSVMKNLVSKKIGFDKSNVVFAGFIQPDGASQLLESKDATGLFDRFMWYFPRCDISTWNRVKLYEPMTTPKKQTPDYLDFQGIDISADNSAAPSPTRTGERLLIPSVAEMVWKPLINIKKRRGSIGLTFRLSVAAERIFGKFVNKIGLNYPTNTPLAGVAGKMKGFVVRCSAVIECLDRVLSPDFDPEAGWEEGDVGISNLSIMSAISIANMLLDVKKCWVRTPKTAKSVEEGNIAAFMAWIKIQVDTNATSSLDFTSTTLLQAKKIKNPASGRSCNAEEVRAFLNNVMVSESKGKLSKKQGSTTVYTWKMNGPTPV